MSPAARAALAAGSILASRRSSGVPAVILLGVGIWQAWIAAVDYIGIPGRPDHVVIDDVPGGDAASAGESWDAADGCGCGTCTRCGCV